MAADGGRVVEFAVEAVSRGRPEDLWRWLSDTNRINRALGNRPSEYRYERDGDRTRRVGRTRLGGREVEYVEEPYEWVTGRFLRTDKTFPRFVMRRVQVWVALDPDGSDGGDTSATRARLGVRVELAPGLEGALAARVIPAMLRGRMRRFLAAVAADPSALSPAGAAMGAVGARLTPVVEGELGARLDRLRGAPPGSHGAPAAALVDRLAAFLREAPDDEVALIRPLALARRLGEEPRALLRALLGAARAGLLDLSWDVHCPGCRGVTHRHARLGSVEAEARCETCAANFGVDLDRALELTFAVSPAVRPVTRSTWCLSGPDSRSHVVVQLRLAAGGERTEVVELPPGRYVVQCVGGVASGGVSGSVLEVVEPAQGSASTAAGGQGELVVELAGGRIRLEAERAAGGSLALCVRSTLDRPSLLLVERAEGLDAWLPASFVTTLQEFRDLFAEELLADGVGLQIATATILFTDLESSTAMYSRLGDGPAFARVRAHFDALGEAIAAEQGAVVKTIGDAVMASFPSPERAVRAAIDAHRRMRALNDGAPGSPPLVLKIGVHAGPCILVTLNGRLDYFGSAVNAAARLQALAHGGEIVVSEALLASPAVRAALAGQAGVQEAERRIAELKGLPAMPIVRFAVAQTGPATPR